jgi:hypothetical protein
MWMVRSIILQYRTIEFLGINSFESIVLSPQWFRIYSSEQMVVQVYR